MLRSDSFDLISRRSLFNIDTKSSEVYLKDAPHSKLNISSIEIAFKSDLMAQKLRQPPIGHL